LSDGKEIVMNMNRNTVALLIGALAVAVVVLGYLVYQDRREPNGVELNVDGHRLSIEKK
jgi:hypothetical protein